MEGRWRKLVDGWIRENYKPAIYSEYYENQICLELLEKEIEKEYKNEYLNLMNNKLNF